MITRKQIEAAVKEEKGVKRDYPNFYQLHLMLREIHFNFGGSENERSIGESHEQHDSAN